MGPVLVEGLCPGCPAARRAGQAAVQAQGAAIAPGIGLAARAVRAASQVGRAAISGPTARQSKTTTGGAGPAAIAAGPRAGISPGRARPDQDGHGNKDEQFRTHI